MLTSKHGLVVSRLTATCGGVSSGTFTEGDLTVLFFMFAEPMLGILAFVAGCLRWDSQHQCWDFVFGFHFPFIGSGGDNVFINELHLTISMSVCLSVCWAVHWIRLLNTKRPTG